jgi:hypothetical protein
VRKKNVRGHQRGNEMRIEMLKITYAFGIWYFSEDGVDWFSSAEYSWED